MDVETVACAFLDTDGDLETEAIDGVTDGGQNPDLPRAEPEKAALPDSSPSELIRLGGAADASDPRRVWAESSSATIGVPAWAQVMSSPCQARRANRGRMDDRSEAEKNEVWVVMTSSKTESTESRIGR